MDFCQLQAEKPAMRTARKRQENPRSADSNFSISGAVASWLNTEHFKP